VFAPFFTLYLDAVGMSAVQIGVLMSMPQITRIFAPHLWGWLADRGGNALRIAQIAGVAGTLSWLGVYVSAQFGWLFAVLLLVMFFWSAALPLVEATTLTHLGDETSRYGRIRVWGSVGFIVAVIAVGYVLDHLPARAVLSIVLATMLAMLAFCWAVPAAQLRPHASDDLSIWSILKRPEVVALIVAAALMSVAHGPYYTFYTIYLVDHGYSKSMAGWLWAFGVICEIGIFVWMPHLYRAFTLRQILLASFALAVLRFVLIGWLVDNVAVMLFAQALHAATFGSFHAAAIGVIHKLFRGRHQARGQVLYGSFAFGLGGVVGGLASGYAWSGLGPAWTFTLSSCAAAAGLLILWWKLRLDPAPQT
jgi:PPP family 3-phenylpropionic acid transporter